MATSDPGRGILEKKQDDERWFIGLYKYITEKNGPFWLAVFIACTVTFSYVSSLEGVFVLDDFNSIVDNSTIWDLSRIDLVLSPPHNSGVASRPLLNLTFALNYAIGGVNPWGYHVVNICIHVGATLLLFGIVRRTLLMPRIGQTWARHALGIAGLVAMLWGVHPLQTESVTFVVQRSESLAGFFYLLTLYAFIRACIDNSKSKWQMLAVAACWCGMATKEAMVSAPMFVLFFDRTLINEDFLSCWKQRKTFYVSLFGSWLLLGWLIAGSGGRYGTGISEAVVSPWEYLMTQCRAIVTYLRLSLWPSPLIFDYGMAVVRDLYSVWPQAVFLSSIAFVTAWATWRRYVAGLLGIWFFFTLAPSSSVVPLITQTMAEHRMYLSLAAIVVGSVAIIYRYIGHRGIFAMSLVIPVLVSASIYRNKQYHSALVLWQDTLEKKPVNPRVQQSMGSLMMEAGRAQDALVYFRKAEEIVRAKDPNLYVDIAAALRELNDLDGAEEALQKILKVKPADPFALCEAGRLYIARGKWTEAERSFSQALAIDPNMNAALINLGVIAARQGNTEKALDCYRAAMHSNPNDLVASINFGNALLRLNHFSEAEEVYRHTIKTSPKSAAGWYGLGCVCIEPARWSIAVGYFERALEIDPKFADAHNNLAGVLLNLNRRGEALSHYEAAVRINPKFGKAQASLATLYAQDGRLAEACERYKTALALIPDDYETHGNLGLVYQLQGDLEKAGYHYKEALRICPGYDVAQQRLDAIKKSQ